MSRILTIGTRGSDVRALQTTLAQIGYSPGPVDGVFGDLTAAAVRSFQLEAGIKVDGLAGRETVAALAARPAPPPPAPCPRALDDGTLPDATRGVWIHRLEAAIERAGGTVDALVRDLQELEVGLVLIKALDGRSLMNQLRLAEVVEALHAAGIRVALWAWVWAVYYDEKTGAPASWYHATVEYCEEQARLLAELCRRHECTAVVYANIEGEGAWSTSSSPNAVWGSRNILLFGSQARADAAIAERADAYAQALEAELPGALLVCSTHGRPSTQRLPWRALCAGFHVIGAQLYNPGPEGYRARVAKACADWRKLGARRVRVSGPAWRTAKKTTKPQWIRELHGVLVAGSAGADVDRGADWWVYELMTPEHRAALTGG